MLFDLLLLVVSAPQGAKDDDHDDGHQKLVEGKTVLSGLLTHGSGSQKPMEPPASRRHQST